MPEGAPKLNPAPPQAAVVEVAGLTCRLTTRAGPVTAVDGLGFTLLPGECLGLLGEAGAGKTIVAEALLGELRGAQVSAAWLRLAGQDPPMTRDFSGLPIASLSGKGRDGIQTFLPIGRQIIARLRRHQRLGRQGARDRAAAILDLVGIPGGRRMLRRFPRQLPAAQHLRLRIALALAGNPVLIIADDPTRGLEPGPQAEVLDLMQELRVRLGPAMIWTSRDPAVIAAVADKTLVLYHGRTLETGPTAALFSTPRHPYTRALLGGGHAVGPRPPALPAQPDSCAFRNHCPVVFEACHRLDPALYPVGPGHAAACLLVDPGMNPATRLGYRQA